MLYTNKKFIFFKYEDFADRISGKNKMRASTIRRLDLARQYASEAAGRDVPFVIVSGYRDENHPETIDNPTSSHANGSAVDIAAYGENAKYIEYGLRKAGFTRIGINKLGNTIHADDDESKTQRVTWFYDGTPTIYNTTANYYGIT